MIELCRYIDTHPNNPRPRLHAAHGLVKLRVFLCLSPPRYICSTTVVAASWTWRQDHHLLRLLDIPSMPQCSCCHDASYPSPSGNCCRSHSAARRQKQTRRLTKRAALLTVLAAALPSTMAQQSCVSLQGSTACPAFTSASVDTNLTGNLYVKAPSTIPPRTNVNRKQSLPPVRLGYPVIRSRPEKLHRDWIRTATVSLAVPCYTSIPEH